MHVKCKCCGTGLAALLKILSFHQGSFLISTISEGLLVHHCFFGTKGRPHRVDRVLGFFSSRRNWDSPTPHPQASLSAPPPQLWLGGGTLACERGGWGVPFPTRGQTLYTVRSTLGMYVFCGRPEAAPKTETYKSPILTFLSSRKSVLRARVALFRLVLSLLWAFTAAATPSIVLSDRGDKNMKVMKTLSAVVGVSFNHG
jgi:hypothetical protein